MKKFYVLLSLAGIFFLLIAISCSKSDDDDLYAAFDASPVVIDLAAIPYPKLSDYKFFKGELKNLEPETGVLPFEPASSLFADYAKKKRFVWMPKGKHATYNTDGSILEMPVGAALIKSFYYENVQNVTPIGASRIIETRILIRKVDGWMFANYIWNEAQTEATFDLAGSFTDVVWKDDDNNIRTANYKIPALVQCQTCHKSQVVANNTVAYTYIPIGIKPQNLNYAYNYGNETKNQLTKWIAMGYLEPGFALPSAQHTVINYSDASKPIDLRARSYVDANCAHCHTEGRHCDYRPMRFSFSDSDNHPENMGVCVNTEDVQYPLPELTKIVDSGSPERSMLFYRISSTDEAVRMPLHGRTIVHEEGVALMQQWINSLPRCE